jgi:hypothetical protein
MAENASASPYKIIDLISFTQDETGHKKPRGSASPRRCRFCQRQIPVVKFSKDAHIVPQAFGNRAHTSLEECDDCNLIGSRLENDLAVYLSLQRAVARIRTGKKDGVKLKPKGDHGGSFIESKANSNLVSVNIDPNDSSVKMQEVADGGVEIIAQRAPYSLINVSKALARMGYFLIPDKELSNFEHIRRWIRGEEDHFPSIFYRGFVPGAGLVRTSLVLFQRQVDDDRLAPLMMHFLFSTAMMIFHYPNTARTTSVHVVPEDEMWSNVQFQEITCTDNGRLAAAEERLLVNFGKKS